MIRLLMKYYAIRKGRNTGVFDKWAEVSKHVTGFKGAEFKSFNSLADAEIYLTLEHSILKTQYEKDTTDQDEIHIYTDGACKSNGTYHAVAGYGVYYGVNDSRNISKKLKGSIQTNNRAELMAVIEAFNSLDSTTKAVIYTDSQYVQKGLESWLSKWKKNHWRTSSGSCVLNQDLWKQLDDSRRRKSLVDVKYVRAHSGILGNEMADRLAVAACSL